MRHSELTSLDLYSTCSLQNSQTPCCTVITCQSCRVTCPAVVRLNQNLEQTRCPGRICWTWTSHPSDQHSLCFAESFSTSFTNALSCDLNRGRLESLHCSVSNRQAAVKSQLTLDLKSTCEKLNWRKSCHVMWWFYFPFYCPVLYLMMVYTKVGHI